MHRSLHILSLALAGSLIAACAQTPEPPPAADVEPSPAVAVASTPETSPAVTSIPEPAPVEVAPEGTHASQFGAGGGPTFRDGAFRVLDAERSPGQSNAVAFDRDAEGARESLTFRCRMRITEGGDGAAVLFLNTAEYGATGPAPFVPSWVEPNLRHSLAVGIDVHNPKNEEPFGDWGNYQDLPEREVSLHWDGREIVKRLADAEFRGDWVDVEIAIRHVCGGAHVSVRIGDAQVYDRYFVADVMPYEARVAIGAGTRDDATCELHWISRSEIPSGRRARRTSPSIS